MRSDADWRAEATRWGDRRCLDRIIFLGEAHLRWTLREFAAHYHQERNHQGLHDRLILPAPTGLPNAPIRCRSRLGGLLRYYHRAA